MTTPITPDMSGEDLKKAFVELNSDIDTSHEAFKKDVQVLRESLNKSFAASDAAFMDFAQELEKTDLLEE